MVFYHFQRGLLRAILFAAYPSHVDPGGSIYKEKCMKLTRITFATAALVVLAGTAVKAQDPRWGLQLTVAKPSGDAGDSKRFDGKIGYGLGANCLIGLGGGHAIVPRLDYIMYKRSEGNVELKANVVSLGADYNYYMSGKANEGFYVAAGLGYSSAKWEITNPGSSYSESKGALYLQGGAGYMFTPNMGAAVTYQSVKYAFDAGDVTAPNIQASFIFRF